MIKSDSLDNITLDSNDIKTIERFENNYYNHKNQLQNGGNNKLENNIVRLFKCYLSSQNQIGGGYNGNLTNIIQTRLNNKIAELIIHSNHFEGGEYNNNNVHIDHDVNNETTSDADVDVENDKDNTTTSDVENDKDNTTTSDVENDTDNTTTSDVENEISETSELSELDTKEKEKEIKKSIIDKITNAKGNAELVEYINKLDMSKIV
jgi:hypothetical protein